MNHTLKATGSSPALVIFLLDISASMGLPLGEKRRIDVITDALRAIIRRMVYLAARGGVISPRYHVALYAYSDKTYRLLDGIKTIGEVANIGVPQLEPRATTNTAQAFAKIEELLQHELPNYAHCPAPVVCHLTDGEITDGGDPEPVAKRIMQMSVADGPVLVENIFMSHKVLPAPIPDVTKWPGIFPDTPLSSDDAYKLRNMTSILPDFYQKMMREMGYAIEPGALMMLPGSSPDLVAMGFAMAGASH